MNPNVIFFWGGGRWGARVNEFFTKKPNLNKNYYYYYLGQGGGRGGAGVSEFVLL